MGWHRNRCPAYASACVLLFVVAACGPTGEGAPETSGVEDTTGVPLDDGADQDGGGDDGGDGDGDGGGDGSGDGGERPRVVLGAPFRVPSPTELSLTGVELADRILAACEAAQPEGEPRPPGPCVEVVIESRPDPDRQPGWWIETVPGGDEEVPYGGTVTVVVADETSPTGEVEPADPLDAPEQDASTGEEGSGDGA